MLITPYGNELVDRYVSVIELDRTLAKTRHLTIRINNDDLINLANLAGGAYSPLTGFMTEDQYLGVINDCKIHVGLDWTIPILLHINDHNAEKLQNFEVVALQDDTGNMVGMVEIGSIFRINHSEYAEKIFSTRDKCHGASKNEKNC